MSTIHHLTYVIYRDLTNSDLPGDIELVAVGAGIVDVDEMSWDEHLLSRAEWVNDPNLAPRYLPPVDVIHFTVHSPTDPPEQWIGTGFFPLDIVRKADLDGDQDHPA